MNIKLQVLFLVALGFTQYSWAESVNLRLNVNFNTNETNLNDRGEETLVRLYEVAKKIPNAEILISGHTDSTGPDVYNLELSLKRASSVAKYLESRGIEAKRLVTKRFGEAAPIADNLTAEGRAKNRRVVASIMGLSKKKLEQVMVFLKPEPAVLEEKPDLEPIEESASVEDYKKELKKARRLKRGSGRYYVTGFLPPPLELCVLGR